VCPTRKSAKAAAEHDLNLKTCFVILISIG